MRKIYFCGSIRAGRQDVDLYGVLTEMLAKYGQVVTPFVADKTITITVYNTVINLGKGSLSLALMS